MQGSTGHQSTWPLKVNLIGTPKSGYLKKGLYANLDPLLKSSQCKYVGQWN